MTNYEYFISQLRETDVAEIFSSIQSPIFIENSLCARLYKAVDRWARDTTAYSNRNFEKEGELPPNIWLFGSIHMKNGEWKESRTPTVRYLQFFSLQYNEKYWKSEE